MTVADNPGTSHVPRRPNWECVVCEEAWPCAPAKVDLVEEYVDERLGLILYLTIQMLDAIDDSAANKVPDPADLHDRFLGWAVGTAPRRV
jgi:hypothetical protein